jgi:hypothetical protein
VRRGIGANECPSPLLVAAGRECDVVGGQRFMCLTVWLRLASLGESFAAFRRRLLCCAGGRLAPLLCPGPVLRCEPRGAAPHLFPGGQMP